MMGHEGQFGLLHRATRIEICTKKAHASSLKHVSLNGMGRIVLYRSPYFLMNMGKK